MKPYKRMSKSTLALLAFSMMSVGAIGAVGAQVFAQSSSATDTPPPQSQSANTNQDASEHPGKGAMHAPLGGDGIVTSINGTTIMMQEEVDEGGEIFTVDASAATVTKDGAASTIASIAVGDKIFVKGTVNGTNVIATEIMDGHKGGWFGKHN